MKKKKSYYAMRIEKKNSQDISIIFTRLFILSSLLKNNGSVFIFHSFLNKRKICIE